MIPSNELRIGNYVLADETLRQITLIDQPSSLTGTCCTGSEPHYAAYSLEDIRPVALTDEVLKQCGFVYHNYFKFWQLLSGLDENRSEMNIDPDHNIIDFMRKPIVKTVRSLHQLQNIYYQLKGKELDFVESRESSNNSPLRPVQ